MTKGFVAFITVLFVSMFSLSIYACGGGGGGGGGSSSAKTGVFIDAPVNGLDYSTSSGQSGVTDVNGTFTYNSGDTVDFSIGAINLGSALGSPIVTPVSLVPNAVDETDPVVTNITRVLLTLDDDSDPTNGINITPLVKDNATDDIDFNLSETDFEKDDVIGGLLNSLTLLTSTGAHGLTDIDSARSHLLGSLTSIERGDFDTAPSGGSSSSNDSSNDSSTDSSSSDLGDSDVN